MPKIRHKNSIRPHANHPLFRTMVIELKERKEFKNQCDDFLSLPMSDISSTLVSKLFNKSSELIISGRAGQKTCDYYEYFIHSTDDSYSSDVLSTGLKKCRTRLERQNKLNKSEQKPKAVEEQDIINIIKATQKEISGLKEFGFTNNDQEVKEAQERLKELTKAKESSPQPKAKQTGVDITKIPGVELGNKSGTWASQVAINSKDSQANSRAS